MALTLDISADMELLFSEEAAIKGWKISPHQWPASKRVWMVLTLGAPTLWRKSSAN